MATVNRCVTDRVWLAHVSEFLELTRVREPDPGSQEA
jgi:hypothetical protein